MERQERETRERNRRADEVNELQRQVDEQVLIAVALEEEENQGRRHSSQAGRRRNVERHRHSRGKNLLEDYFIPTSLYSDVDFRRRFRMQPHLFNKVMHDICNYDAYFVQKCDATGVLRLLPEQKLTAVIRMLAYGASADQVDEIARMGSPLRWRIWLDFFKLLKLCTLGTTYVDLLPGTSNGFYKKPKLEDFQE